MPVRPAGFFFKGGGFLRKRRWPLLVPDYSAPLLKAGCLNNFAHLLFVVSFQIRIQFHGAERSHLPVGKPDLLTPILITTCANNARQPPLAARRLNPEPALQQHNSDPGAPHRRARQHRPGLAGCGFLLGRLQH